MRWRRGSGRQLLILLAAAAIFRFSLLDRGTSAFVDETLYFTSVMALQSLARGDLQEAAGHIADARGRQGAALLQLPVAALQGLPSAFGVPASNPRSLMIPAAFNVFASLAALFFFFRTVLVLVDDEASALAAATLHALLVNTNLYLRHVLPYEWSLCAAAAAMWIIASRPSSPRTAVIAGTLAGSVVTLYSGFYLLAVVLGAAFAVQSARRDGLRIGTARTIQFAASAAVVLGAVEAVCRLGGVSYIASSRALGATIAMGSFDEGWTFLPEYLWRVEGIAGALLLSGIGLWAALLLRRLWRREQIGALDIWMLCALGGWIVQAVLAAELRRIVFYGRLLHPWMLFLALAVAHSIASLKSSRLRQIVAGGVVVLALASALVWYPSYRTLAYPSDILYSLGIDTTRLSPDRVWCEFAPGTPYASPGPLNRSTRFPYTDSSDFLLINFCQDFSSGRRRLEELPAGASLLFDGPHWLSFPAYTYDGFLPDARDEMVRTNYRVRAYRLSE